MLAELNARLEHEEEARKRTMRRTAYGAGVAALHVLFLFLLIMSEWVPIAIPNIEKIEPLTWIILTQPAKAPRIIPVKPKKSELSGAVTTVVPPRIPKPEEEENNAIDLGLAIGRSLACSANSYEWLNSRQRAACLRRPWQFAYDPYGNVVLDAAPRVVAAEKPRPSDIQAHERNTADPCLIAKQSGTDCIDKVIFGDHR